MPYISKPSMFSRLRVRLIFAALITATPLFGEERNIWPFAVQQIKPDQTVESAEYVGPLFFEKSRTDGAHFKGFRPLYLQIQEGNRETTAFLYPFFTWQKEADYRYFTFFELINFRRQTDSDQQTIRNFDVWPFYFSRDSGDPESSYRAVFPLGGTIKNRFGKDRIHFVLFPLYANVEKSGAHTTHAPWPFLRFIDGAGEHGFEFWPLFGHHGRQNDYDSRFYLWPLIYKSSKNLSEPQPDVKLGVLPFYSRDTSPGYINENYLWPFFGTTHRTMPVKYDERRYFWPFLVQGRGDVTNINRWAPFYTHSINKGMDKTWIAWPVFRHSEWEDNGIKQDKDQVLFFLYWSLTQHSLSNPNAASAHKTHLWPLVSSWDNGAGRRQLQVLSPFEVFFPTNEPVRQLYTPLFALYRYEQRAPQDTRHSVLFSLFSWKKSPVEKEFHFGPLFSKRSVAGYSRFSLGLGLLSWQRTPDSNGWKFALFDFRRQNALQAPVAQSP
jgi:hypothetical protein